MRERWRMVAVRLAFALEMALHGVLSKPLRSALTVLSVVIGVASVVTLISIGEGARQAVVRQFESLGENVILIEAQDSSVQFSSDLVEELVERVPTLSYATPVVEVEAAMRWRRARTTADVLGVNADFPLIRDHRTVSGRFFSELHVDQRSPVAVLGYEYGRALLGGRSPVGQTLTLNGRTFRIIGVLAPKGSGQAGGIDKKVLIPYTVAQQLARTRSVHQIWAKAASTQETDLAVAQLGRIFRREIGLDPAAPSGGGGGEMPGGGMPPDMMPGAGAMGRAVAIPAPDMPGLPPDGGGGGEVPGGGGIDKDPAELVTVTSLNQAVKSADLANRIMTVLLGGIAAVSLLVGGIGIMNIMLVSVSERTNEIGLRKALGAHRSDLMAQFLLEAFMLSAAGAVFGLALARGSAAIAGRFGLETAMTPEALAVAVGAALTVGIVFGGYPAWLASSLQPVEALRSH